MLCITLAVASPLAHHVSGLELTANVHELNIEFHDGTHLYTSPYITLGSVQLLGGRALKGRLTFRYTYNAAHKVIKVCGTDYPSSDGMTLATSPEGSDEVCLEHAADTGFPVDEIHRNKSWNTRSRLMPGAAEIFKNIVRDANNTLIKALKDEGTHNVLVRELLPELAMDDYLKLCFVYRDGKFYELYNPGHTYGPEDVVKAPESVFGGTVYLANNQSYANVIGTTTDPKHGVGSWIALWKATYNGVNPPFCSSFQFPEGFPCKNGPYGALGGHVLMGQVAEPVAYGKDHIVFIMPICTTHNNNNNVYMEPITNNAGVWLDDYHE